jgi:tetratricopeptide (TPR) repeat protein
MPIDPSRLSARVRDVLRGQPGPAGTRDRAHPLDEAEAAGEGVREIRFVPDEDVPTVDRPTGCVVIERDYPSGLWHGRASVGDYAIAMAEHLSALSFLSAEPFQAAPVERPGRFEWDGRRRVREARRRPGAPTRGPLLFFDLETTGLSGGVGTLAFLVGCGYFEDDEFRTRQFFLSGYDAEHELLVALAELTRRFGGLVTFNGRTFDVPLIEMRYAFHRLDSPFEDLPHFDMLQPARRLWRRRGTAASGADEWVLTAPGADSESCALKSLEEAILKTGRVGDVPGFEIPSRYFAYLRTGDLEPLQAVFEHNRLDLLSLAALTALASQMASGGPSAVPSAHESLAMGQLYECAGRDDHAEACFSQAAGLPGSPWDPRTVETDIRADALRKLALLRRRLRRYVEAADAWEALLTVAARTSVVQEALQALAIHHEHRTRDLESARRLAETAAAAEHDPARAAALGHRLDRLRRKQHSRRAGR